MQRFSRLFWKIFLALWFVSFSVILVTAIVVSELIERKSSQELLEYRARSEAQRIIERYEGGARSERFEWMLKREKSREHGRDEHFRRTLPLLINIDEQTIYGHPDLKKRDVALTFEIVTGQGRYQVRVPADPLRSHVARIQTFLFSMQAVLVLISSALGSLLLSWVIVRPVNRLRDYVALLHKGDIQARMAPDLLSRGDEIGALAREFDLMAQYVERTLQGQQRLLQDVSHELRAPLARLQAAAGLAEQQLGEDNKISRRMSLECERLSRLIDEMLSFARLDNLEPVATPFAAQPVVLQVVEDMRFAHPDRTLTCDLAAEQGMLCGNSELLARALNNVLGNCMQHTPAQAAVELRLTYPTPEQLQLVVRDHGDGVPEAMLQTLFEPFFRHSQTTTGYGLGLSIARRAIERLGGVVEASNHPEGGLQITLRLPCHTPAASVR